MPNSATPELREIARRLLECESAAGTGEKNSETYRVWAKLRPPLEKLIGVNGFRSLTARARALASAEVPALHTLEIEADGSLQGLNEIHLQAGSDAIAAGEVALVSQLLALLVTFIGSALTLALLRDIWPDLDCPDF